MRGLQEIIIADLLDYMKYLGADLDKKGGRLRVYNTFKFLTTWCESNFIKPWTPWKYGPIEIAADLKIYVDSSDWNESAMIIICYIGKSSVDFCVYCALAP